MRSKIALILLVTLLTLSLSAPTFANGTNTGPGTLVQDFPFNDTGEINDADYTNNYNFNGAGCGLPANAYGGNDVFYALDLLVTGTYSFVLTSDTPGVTDFAIFLVRDFGDNGSCVANSQDSIDDFSPEVIAGFEGQRVRYYLVVDTYDAEPTYPKYGTFTLEATCEGGCVYNDIPTLSIAGKMALAAVLLLLGGFAFRRFQAGAA